MKKTPTDLDRLAEQETAHFLRRSSLTYLECCVSLMLTHMAKEDVAALLEREAELLREFDCAPSAPRQPFLAAERD